MHTRNARMGLCERDTVRRAGRGHVSGGVPRGPRRRELLPAKGDGFTRKQDRAALDGRARHVSALVLLALVPCLGHRPLLTKPSCDGDFGSSAEALVIPDPSISWAFKTGFIRSSSDFNKTVDFLELLLARGY